MEEAEQEGKRLSWATRSLRRLKARITKVGGKKDQPKEQEWQLEDAAQWELLFQGKEVFWKAAGAIRAEGYDSIYSLTQDANEKHSPTPLLTREGPGSSLSFSLSESLSLSHTHSTTRTSRTAPPSPRSVRGRGERVCVCVYYCRTYYKAVRVGGGG